jgi:DNA polymerase-3 subunit beta
MIITVNSQHLAQALRCISKIVPAQPTIQILGSVLVEATDVLRLLATDLEVGLTVICPAVITRPGTCALPALPVLQLLEQFSDGTVTIVTDESGTRIQYGTFVSKLQTFLAAEFPRVPRPEGTAISLSGADIGRLVTATRYAVAERGKKFILEGALLKLAGHSMGMIATDTNRLSIATVYQATDANLAIIVPRKTLDIIPLLGIGTLDLHVGTNHVFFASRDMLLTSRLIEGKFPAYERIVPRDNDKRVIVERTRLAAALRRVGVAADKNAAAYCTIEAHTLTLSAKSVEVGEAAEHLPIQYNGTPLTVCLNWQYLLDFLTVAIGQTITIDVKNEQSPLLVSDGISFLNVIMTMRG